MMQVCRNVIGESLSDILIKGTEAEQEMRYQRILDVHKETYIAHQESAWRRGSPSADDTSDKCRI